MRPASIIEAFLFLSALFVILLTSVACADVISSYAQRERISTEPLKTVRFSNINGTLKVHPDNPRYFTDSSGRAVLLTGSHTWMNLQDIDNMDPVEDRFDYETYINTLAAHNHNFFRLWTWEEGVAAAAQGNFWFDPTPFQRTGPGFDQAGKPKFDLTRFNEAYFNRLRSRVILAGQRGIYVSVMLFDGWSIENKDGSRDPWYGHPYNRLNNINGIDGDPNRDGKGTEIHTLQIPAVTALQKAYVRKVIDSVNDLDNVLYEISNESPGGSQDWQYEMIEFIKSYENQLPKQHPVGMTVEYPGGENTDIFNSPADWVSPNGDIDNPPAADGSKVILYDMDHLCGLCKNSQYIWKGFTRGMNPIFMDPYDFDILPSVDLNDPVWEKNRKDMGYVLTYANRMNLVAMTPHGELSSSGYALANPAKTGAEYFIYIPTGGSVSVDLTATPSQLYVEWFNPASGMTFAGSPVVGGSNVQLRPPFSGEAILYLCVPASKNVTKTPQTLTTTTTQSNVPDSCTKATSTYVPLIVRNK